MKEICHIVVHLIVLHNFSMEVELKFDPEILQILMPQGSGLLDFQNALFYKEIKRSFNRNPSQSTHKLLYATHVYQI